MPNDTAEALVKQVFSYKYSCGKVTLDKTVTLFQDGKKDVEYVLIVPDVNRPWRSFPLTLTESQWDSVKTLAKELS